MRALAAPPGIKFLPNAITVLALCAGLTSVNFALRERWFLAVVMIATAAVLDSLDGPAARLLDASSRIGAELDSLSDCVSFGIAPALVMFLWALDDNPLGWAFCLVYAVCTTLRLARFNSALDDEAPPAWSKLFFTGIPSPAGALLALQPLSLDVRLGHPDRPEGDFWWTNSWVIGIWLVLIGILMVSKVPSIALKNVFIPARLILPSLILLVIAVTAAFYEPQIMFALGLFIYVAHLPYAAWKRRHLREHPELFEDPTRRRARARARRNNRMRPRIPGKVRVAGRYRDGRPLPRAARPRPVADQPDRPRPLGRRRLR